MHDNTINDTDSHAEYFLVHGSKEHIQELTRLGWTLDRLTEYFRHELTLEQITEWINVTN